MSDPGLSLDGIGSVRRGVLRPRDPSLGPFLSHAEELRARFFGCVLAVTVFSAVGYALRGRLLALLVSPLGGPLYFSSPVGGFDLALRTSIFFGVVAALPFCTYQLLKFIQPALPSEARSHLGPVLVASGLLAAAGLLFAYFLSLPAALRFLQGFSSAEVRSLISTDQYLSFVTAYLAGFAITFQLPVVILFVNSFHPLTVRALLGGERWVILVSFVTAAVLTPTPDPVNQTIMALPLIALYNLSIAGVWAANSRRARALGALATR